MIGHMMFYKVKSFFINYAVQKFCTAKYIRIYKKFEQCSCSRYMLSSKGGIHKLRFVYFWPHTLYWQVFCKCLFCHLTNPPSPLLVNVVYGCHQIWCRPIYLSPIYDTDTSMLIRISKITLLYFARSLLINNEFLCILAKRIKWEIQHWSLDQKFARISLEVSIFVWFFLFLIKT